MGEIRKACNVLIETPKRNTQKTKAYNQGNIICTPKSQREVEGWIHLVRDEYSCRSSVDFVGLKT
jgi:hypothetical protein